MQRIEDTTLELFGLGAIQHFLGATDQQAILTAMAETRLTGDAAFYDLLNDNCAVALYSPIDRIEPEPLTEYFEGYGRVDDATQQLLDYVFGLQRRGRILDIGCGAGRFLQIFKAQQFETVGIDISKLMVWLCMRLGLGAVHCQSMFNLSTDLPRFDCFLLLGFNLGIGGTVSSVAETLQRCAERSNPKGLLLVNSIDIGVCDQEYAKNRLAYNRQFPARHPGETDYVIQFGHIKGEAFPWIHLGPEEVGRIGGHAGWTLEQVFFDAKESGHWTGLLRLAE